MVSKKKHTYVILTSNYQQLLATIYLCVCVNGNAVNTEAVDVPLWIFMDLYSMLVAGLEEKSKWGIKMMKKDIGSGGEEKEITNTINEEQEIGAWIVGKQRASRARALQRQGEHGGGKIREE